MTMARPTSRADGGGGNALKGTWDEVTIHDVKLTAGEVDSLFHAGPGTNVVNTLPSSSEILVDAFSTEFESRGGRICALECADDLVADNWTDASNQHLSRRQRRHDGLYGVYGCLGNQGVPGGDQVATARYRSAATGRCYLPGIPRT